MINRIYNIVISRNASTKFNLRRNKMSNTLKNLESALAGESQAHIKYRYFAKIAREEGFEEVAKHQGCTRIGSIVHVDNTIRQESCAKVGMVPEFIRMVKIFK